MTALEDPSHKDIITHKRILGWNTICHFRVERTITLGIGEPKAEDQQLYLH